MRGIHDYGLLMSRIECFKGTYVTPPLCAANFVDTILKFPRSKYSRQG